MNQEKQIGYFVNLSKVSTEQLRQELDRRTSVRIKRKSIAEELEKIENLVALDEIFRYIRSYS